MLNEQYKNEEEKEEVLWFAVTYATSYKTHLTHEIEGSCHKYGAYNNRTTDHDHQHCNNSLTTWSANSLHRHA